MGAIKQQMIQRQELGLCIVCACNVPEPFDVCEQCEAEQAREQAEQALRAAVAECQRLRVSVDAVLADISAEQLRLFDSLPPIMPGRQATDEEIPF